MPLPVDAKVQATVAPTSRSDIVAIFENAQRMACVAMGVPVSEIGISGGHRLASDAEMSEGVLHNTLARFKMLLSQCLIDVYTALYGERPGLEVRIRWRCMGRNTIGTSHHIRSIPRFFIASHPINSQRHHRIPSNQIPFHHRIASSSGGVPVIHQPAGDQQSLYKRPVDARRVQEVSGWGDGNASR